MPLQTADRLAFQHRRELARIAAEAQTAVAATVRTATPAAISTWYAGVADTLLARVSAGYAQTRRAAAEFLRRHAAANGVTLDPVPASLDMTQARTALRVTGPVAFKTSIAAGVDETHAMRSMSTQLQGSTQRLVMAGDRDTFESTLVAGRGIIGWRRRLGGKGCGFCAMLASRGAVYVSRHAATVARDGLRYHDHCHCFAEPLYRHEQEPADVRQLQRMWQHVTAGETGEDKARVWRDHWENHVTPEARARAGIAETQRARVAQVFGETRGRLAELGVPPVRRAVASGLPGFAAPAEQVRAVLLRPKTVRGVEQVWRTEMRRITGRDIEVSIPDGTSVLTSREYAEGVLRGLEAFPDAQLLRVEFATGLPANEYAHVEAGVIRFNARLANEANRPLLLDSLRGDISHWEDGVGWSTRGDGTTTSMAIHEFGHIVDDSLSIRIHDEALLTMDTLARQAGLDTDTWVVREISAYSGSDAHEMVAEAFADVMLRGDAASVASRRIFEVLERKYAAGGKRVGITPGVRARAAAEPLTRKTVPELRTLARERGVTIPAGAKKPDIIRLLEGGPASDLTGARGLSTVPAVRQVQIENRIRAAYDETAQLAGGGVKLTDLRQHLAGLPRDEVDAALIRLGRKSRVSILPNEGRLGLTPADRAAAVHIGDQPYHYLLIEDGNALRPLPTAVPKPAEVPLAKRPVAELRTLAAERDIPVPPKVTKAELVRRLQLPDAEVKQLRQEAAREAKALTGKRAQAAVRPTRLTETQQAALDRMGGDGAYVVNADLRDRAGRLDLLTDRNRQTVETLDAVFDGSVLPQEAILHRKIGLSRGPFGDLANADHDLTGFTWTEDAYSSTSIAARLTGPPQVQVRIFAPKGTRAVSYRTLDADEVLLDRGTTFRVVADHGKNSRFDRVIDVEIVPRPALTPAQLQRQAARAKAAQIEQATGTAKLLAEVDRLLAAKAETRVIRQALDPKLIGRESLYAGADPAVLAGLRAVADDPVKLRAAVTRLGTKAKVKPISRAGAKVKYDAATMEPVGGDIAAGTQVTVVSRGASVTLPDGTVVQLAKAKVTPVTTKATTKPLSADLRTAKGIRAAHTVKDEQTGLTSEVEHIGRVDVDTYGDQFDGWKQVDLSIGNEDVQGFATIFISPDRTSVYYAALVVPDELQAQGAVTRLIGGMLEKYKAAGVRELGIRANANVGGYAWARAGFQFYDEQARLEFARYARDYAAGRPVERYGEHYMLGPAKFATKVDAKTRDAIRRVADNPDAQPADYAAIGWTQGAKDWPGKRFMLGSFWRGKMKL